MVYENLNENEKALDFHEKSLKINEKIFGEVHHSTATSYNNMGLVYENLGSNEKSLEMYEKSLELKRKIFGETDEHPTIGISLYNIGNLLFKIGKLIDAADYMERCL